MTAFNKQVATNQIEAMRFALQGVRYSRTRIAQGRLAELVRGLRISKLASLVKSF